MSRSGSVSIRMGRSYKAFSRSAGPPAVNRPRRTATRRPLRSSKCHRFGTSASSLPDAPAHWEKVGPRRRILTQQPVPNAIDSEPVLHRLPDAPALSRRRRILTQQQATATDASRTKRLTGDGRDGVLGEYRRWTWQRVAIRHGGGENGQRLTCGRYARPRAPESHALSFRHVE